jgi:hypothetical protein
MNEKEDIQLIKLLALSAFLLIIIDLIIILLTPSSNGFELNIYSTYPWYFWMFLVLSIFIGTLILLKSYISKLRGNYWLYGFAAILLSNTILLIMPIIRNYIVFGRGDILTHLGWLKNIIASGNFGTDMYPMIHIIASSTYYFTGISIENITILFYTIFSIFYILSFYLLYSQIFKDKNRTILAMVFTSIMIFATSQTSFIPFTLSLFIIPFYLYLYFKERESHGWNYRALLAILTAFIILFHPITAIMVLFTIIIIEFSRFIFLRINNPGENFLSKFSIILVLMIISGFVLWKQYFFQLVNSLFLFYYLIISGLSPNLTGTLSLLNKANFIDIIISTMYIFGAWIIVILISIITIFLLIRKNLTLFKLSPRGLLNLFRSLQFYQIFSTVGFLFFTVLSLFVYLKLPIFGFARILQFSFIFVSFLMFYFFYQILNSKNIRLNSLKYGKIVLISIIVLPIICFSTINLYLSPIILTPNAQVTEAEIDGMTTFFSFNDSHTRILELGISQYRFEDYIYGEQADIYGQDAHILNLSNTSRTAPLDHFGYENNTTLNKFYKMSVYVAINDIGIDTYPMIYPGYEDSWRFNPDDFTKFNNTAPVSLIYNNGNLNIYKT